MRLVISSGTSFIRDIRDCVKRKRKLKSVGDKGLA